VVSINVEGDKLWSGVGYTGNVGIFIGSRGGVGFGNHIASQIPNFDSHLALFLCHFHFTIPM